MGLLTKVLSKLIRPETERPKRRPVQDHLQDQLQDPLSQPRQDTAPPRPTAPQRTEGSTLAKGLKKSGGKSWNKKSNYAGILDDLRGLDSDEITDAERIERASAVRGRVQEWAEKHGLEGKRGKAMKGLWAQLDSYKKDAKAGWDPLARQALDDPSNPTQEGLAALGKRSRQLKDEVTRLEEKRKQSAHLDDQGPYQRANSGARATGMLRREIDDDLVGMEKSYLQGKVNKEGLTGGKLTSVLGSGGIGTAYNATFGDKDLVFKEETPVGDALLSGGVTNEIGSMRAVASKEVDDLLGTDVLTGTELAEAGGKYGIAMEKAVGTPTRQKEDVSDITDKSLFEGHYVSPNKNETFLDTGVDYSDPVVQKGLVDLQINDVISGQLDRHAGNYVVEQNENGQATGVRGFDNDLSFPSQMGDWQTRIQETKKSGRKFGNAVDFPPLMTEQQASMVEGLDPKVLQERLSKHLPGDEVSSAVQRLGALKQHIAGLRDNDGIIKGYDQDSYQRLRNAGEQKSYVGRDSLQQDNMKVLAEKLQRARNPEKRDD